MGGGLHAEGPTGAGGAERHLQQPVLVAQMEQDWGAGLGRKGLPWRRGQVGVVGGSLGRACGVSRLGTRGVPPLRLARGQPEEEARLAWAPDDSLSCSQGHSAHTFDLKLVWVDPEQDG